MALKIFVDITLTVKPFLAKAILGPMNYNHDNCQGYEQDSQLEEHPRFYRETYRGILAVLLCSILSELTGPDTFRPVS